MLEIEDGKVLREKELEEERTCQEDEYIQWAAAKQFSEKEKVLHKHFYGGLVLVELIVDHARSIQRINLKEVNAVIGHHVFVEI